MHLAIILPMEVIAHIHTDFPQKFGVPRQSGVVESLKATIHFEPKFADPSAVRGIEGFSHLWLIWQFEGVERPGPDGTPAFNPTVRPPRLGGNQRMGVFATRSPFRPNALGLSSVKLEKVERTPDGPVLHVSGADLRDNTPIFDIKPYLPSADCHPQATGGFTDERSWHPTQVDFPSSLQAKVPAEKLQALTDVLAQDPRPSFQHDPDRIYSMAFGTQDVRFTVSEEQGQSVLHVIAVEERSL